MFNISGFELLLIGIVALLVIGPERLPQVAQKLGRFVGFCKQSFAQIQKNLNEAEETPPPSNTKPNHD